LLNKFRKTKTFTGKLRLCPQLTSWARHGQKNHKLEAHMFELSTQLLGPSMAICIEK
jgi:hypothetical protein